MAFVDVAGRWPVLRDRLVESNALSRWCAAEPALRRVRSVGELPALTGEGADPTCADRVLGALVRLAAVDGGDDGDAALVVVHLLRPGICRLAGRMAYRGPQVMAVVVSEVMCAIRAFPWRRRTRAYASNIIFTAKHDLWRGELAPLDSRCRPWDPVELTRIARLRADDNSPHDAAEAEVSAELELADLLAAAKALGLVAEAEVELLLEIERRRCYGAAVRRQIAAERGISVATLQRRRLRTLDALRGAARWQLESVA